MAATIDYALGDHPIDNINVYWRTATKTDRLAPEQWSHQDIGGGMVRITALQPLPPDAELVVQKLPGARSVKPPIDLKAYSAAARWQRETGGCVVDGHKVATDRDSQSKYLAEFVTISAGMRADPSPWKFADGEFAMLTNAEMASVIMGVRAHVAGAFGLEMTVLAGIAAGTITTKAEIDEQFATL